MTIYPLVANEVDRKTLRERLETIVLHHLIEYFCSFILRGCRFIGKVLFMWLLLALLSAFFLGLYDVSKKVSLKNNAVLPVIWTSIAFSTLLLLPFFIISRVSPQTLEGTLFFVPEIDLKTHLQIFLKSVIVLISWIFAYFALKNLPLTIASPLKATQPIWTVLGGVLILGERLDTMQIVGVSITLLSFLAFSVVGRKEGISFIHNKWIWCALIGIFAGTASALYDKFLMVDNNHMAVLSYYTFYQLIVMGVLTMILWFPQRKKSTPFKFKWTIILISLFLISADFIYFYALSLPDALISVVSPIRRSGVIIPFLFGAIFLKDKNIKLKAFCLLGVLAGVICLLL